MNGRNVENRIIKLEANRRRPNDILLVWRRPDADVRQAVAGAKFEPGDKVICAEWFDDGPLPAPRWYKNRLSSEMDADEYEQIELNIKRVALAEPKRNTAGFAPFPRFSEALMKEMTDAELIHAVLGVRA